MSRFVPPFTRWDERPNEDNGWLRLHFRLWQLEATVLVLLFTTWVCTFGVIPAFVALLVAKHLLVCILMIKLDREAAHSPDL
jgi:hypothetical protein